MEREEFNKKLEEKFNELSELFDDIKDDLSIEPEQKTPVIDAMLSIYNVLFEKVP